MQVFSCEYCKVFKKAFFTEHLTTASRYSAHQNDFHTSNMYLFYWEKSMRDTVDDLGQS